MGAGGGGGGGSTPVRFPVVYSPRRSTVMSGTDTDEYCLLTRPCVSTPRPRRYQDTRWLVRGAIIDPGCRESD